VRKAIIIQARTGSKRYPNKILKKIDYRSVLEFLIEKLIIYFSKDELIIATTNKKNDKKICSIAKNYNINFFKGNENDLVKRYFKCAKKFKISIIIRVTSDCPLIDPLLINKMLKYFTRKNLDYYSNTCPPNLSRFPDGSDIEIFNFKSLQKLNILKQSKSDREHLAGFWKNNKIFNTKLLSKKNNLSKYKFSLDYKSDLILLKSIVKNLKKKNMNGSADQIVHLIKRNSKLKKISNINRLKYLKNRVNIT